MKKFLGIAAMIFILAGTLAGCMQAPQQEQTPTTTEPDTMTEPTTQEPAMYTTVADKIAHIDTLGTAYTGIIVSGCSAEAAALNTSLKGTAKSLTLAPDLSVIQTANPDMLTKAALDKITNPCAELGSLQAIDATNDSILWSYPYCTAGVIPETNMQPQYQDYLDCLKVQNELANLYGLEVEPLPVVPATPSSTTMPAAE